MAKAFGATASRALRTAAGKSDSRTRMMQAVRAACRRLHIDEEDRRSLQEEVIGKTSMSDMDLSELGKLLDHLNRGWNGPMGHRAYIGKIRALWWTLYWLGAVNEPNDPALETFVERQTGKARLQFLGHKEAFSVIEALKGWAAREGVEWPGKAQLAELAARHPDMDLPRLDRHAVLAAIGAKLRSAGALSYGYENYCEKALSLPCNHITWSGRQLDDCIKLLGKRLRHTLSRQERPAP